MRVPVSEANDLNYLLGLEVGIFCKSLLLFLTIAAWGGENSFDIFFG
jgi:hypothetical protein